jgi:uncharacterized protein (DUF885 family)
MGISAFLLSLTSFQPLPKFDAFSSEFVSGYKALHLPQLELSYVSGFQHIQSADSVQMQLDFFNSIKKQLPSYNTKALTPSQKLDYQLIKYETGLNLQRIALEQQWVKNPPHKISTDGIITIPNGKAWYAYLLKRWVGDDISPDSVFQFGLTEVAKVKKHIETIQLHSGMNKADFYKHLNDPSFFISDPKEVQKDFEHIKSIIYANMHKLFSVTKVLDLKIEQGAEKALAQTPGYYSDNTFYYNLFDKPYNNRQIDWLFIHEGVPGHHYQHCIAAQAKTSAVQQLFFYLGYAEGWGAYAEYLGKDLGVYKTPYDELGKWEWDIVRSVRVPLDVALNYYGWTDEKALEFWKKNIKGQDDIALREIARMRRWPAQVVTYKYGAAQFLQWKNTLQRKQGKNFNIKDFHDRVLNQGTLPLFLVKENVFKGS